MLDKDKRIIVFNVDISNIPLDAQDGLLRDYALQCQHSFTDGSVKTLIFATNNSNSPKAEVITDFPVEAREKLFQILEENKDSDTETLINKIKEFIDLWKEKD